MPSMIKSLCLAGVLAGAGLLSGLADSDADAQRFGRFRRGTSFQLNFQTGNRFKQFGFSTGRFGPTKFVSPAFVPSRFDYRFRPGFGRGFYGGRRFNRGFYYCP